MAVLTPPPAPARVAGRGRRALVRVLALAAAAVLLAALVLPWRPATLCLLRAVTGVPCPVCGSTTALVELGRGRPLAALAANPLTALSAPLWALWPVLGPVLQALLRGGGTTGRRLLAHRWRLLLLAVAASQLWQLHRLG